MSLVYALTSVFTVNRQYRNARVISSSSTSLRPCSSAGTLPGSMSFSAEYNRHGFFSRLHLEQVNKSSRSTHSGHASTLICKRHNDSGAGFPRSDGRLPSLPEPILRDANQGFPGQPIHDCANIRFAGLQKWPPADFVVGCRKPFAIELVG